MIEITKRWSSDERTFKIRLSKGLKTFTTVRLFNNVTIPSPFWSRWMLSGDLDLRVQPVHWPVIHLSTWAIYVLYLEQVNVRYQANDLQLSAMSGIIQLSGSPRSLNWHYLCPCTSSQTQPYNGLTIHVPNETLSKYCWLLSASSRTIHFRPARFYRPSIVRSQQLTARLFILLIRS